MRIFLFGSYAIKKSNQKSDIDIFITNTNLSGFVSSIPTSVNSAINQLRKHSLEEGGDLDLFIDMKDSFQSPYSERILFGKDFYSNLHYIQQHVRELELEELKDLLSIRDYSERIEWLNKYIFSRNRLLEGSIVNEN